MFLGGFLAGVLDITYAIVVVGARGRSPLWVLQSVASGLLGQKAFEGGVATGLLGLLSHFFIATSAAGVYFIGARRLAFLRRHAVISGAVFGVLVYLFMNFVVIPLSAFPLKVSYPPAVLVRGFFFHILLVGLPIALSVSRFSFATPERSRA